MLAGCSDRWSELDPRPVVANIFGAHLEGREPPPGLDQPWPNLASVPARPVPPDPAARARLSEGLAQDRAAAREAQQPSLRAAPPAPGAAPPPPPRLAAMPAPSPSVVPGAPPVLPAESRPAAPAAPPVAPPAELLAPPPPSRDLLAPRRD